MEMIRRRPRPRRRPRLLFEDEHDDEDEDEFHRSWVFLRPRAQLSSEEIRECEAPAKPLDSNLLIQNGSAGDSTSHGNTSRKPLTVPAHKGVTKRRECLRVVSTHSNRRRTHQDYFAAAGGLPSGSLELMNLS
jgi:hypothetical protein